MEYGDETVQDNFLYASYSPCFLPQFLSLKGIDQECCRVFPNVTHDILLPASKMHSETDMIL